MTEISESRTREIQHWLDDRLAEPDLPYQAMAILRDAAALIRQLQAAEQAAWHAGLDAGREQGRGKDHAHQPPIAPVGVEGLPAKWRNESKSLNIHPAGLAARRVCACDLEHALEAVQPAAVDEPTT